MSDMKDKYAPLWDAARGGVQKFITFKLGGEEYGIELLKLRELIGVPEITPIPRAKGHIRGLINLRGKVIPVLDLRAKFGLSMTDLTDQSLILVVTDSANHILTGILVDEVLEVRALLGSEVEPPPELRDQPDTSFNLGVGKVAARSVFLLDIDRILASEPRAQSLALN